MAKLFSKIKAIWTSHPRLPMAVRAAIAATLAWLAAGIVPDALDDTPYYAPFGAVIATTMSMAGSVRESIQAVAAMIAGGLVAWVVGWIPAPALFIIGLTVAGAVLIAALRWLGPMRSWVPTAAIFTLIVGNTEADYIGSFALLMLLGAAVGIGVTLVFPPLPIAVATAALNQLRTATAVQLDLLADSFEGRRPSTDREVPSTTISRSSAEDLRRARTEMHDATALVHDARRGNRRARRHQQTLEDLSERSARLDRVAVMVAELRDLVLHPQHSPVTPDEEITIPEEIWIPLISALRSTAEALRNPDEAERHTDIISTRFDQIMRIRDTVPGAPVYLVDALILTLRRGWMSVG